MSLHECDSMAIRDDQTEEVAARDRHAEDYVATVVGSKARGEYWLRAQTGLVLRALQLSPGRLRIYDAGSGVGIYALEIARRYPKAQLLCVDFSPRSIDVLAREAKKRMYQNVTPLVANVITYQPQPNAFDRAMCNEVLQHLPSHESRLDTLRHIRISLKEGGILVTTNYHWGGFIRAPTPKDDHKHGGFKFTRHAFTEIELQNLLEEAGFRRVISYGILRLPSRFRRLVPSKAATAIEQVLIVTKRNPISAQFVLAVGEK
jgi:SAM-dependent methyltransferase